MKNRFKFKFWDFTYKRFVNDPTINECGRILEWFGLDCRNDIMPLQYTGLLDKSGKEIYEGDVLVFDKDGHREYGHTVVFSFGKFELKMPDYNMNIDIGYHSEMIIIGNIFENPELLKNEK